MTKILFNIDEQVEKIEYALDCQINNKDKMEECRMDFVLETAYLENLLMPVPEEKSEPGTNNSASHKHKGHTKTKK